MPSSYYSKDFFDLNDKIYVYRGIVDIPISTSVSFINLFKIPDGYNFIMTPFIPVNTSRSIVLFNNLTLSGGLSATFSENGEYFTTTSGIPDLKTVYTAGTAINVVKEWTGLPSTNDQSYTKIWQLSGTDFKMRFTNTTRSFKVSIILMGYLVKI